MFNKKYLKQSFVLDTAGVQLLLKTASRKIYSKYCDGQVLTDFSTLIYTMRPVHRHGGMSSSKNFNMAQILNSNSLRPSNKTLRCPIK